MGSTSKDCWKGARSWNMNGLVSINSWVCLIWNWVVNGIDLNVTTCCNVHESCMCHALLEWHPNYLKSKQWHSITLLAYEWALDCQNMKENTPKPFLRDNSTKWKKLESCSYWIGFSFFKEIKYVMLWIL
jgi:hypothetical protein